MYDQLLGAFGQGGAREARLCRLARLGCTVTCLSSQLKMLVPPKSGRSRTAPHMSRRQHLLVWSCVGDDPSTDHNRWVKMGDDPKPDPVPGIPQRNNNARRVRSLAEKEGHHLELISVRFQLCHGALQAVLSRLVRASCCRSCRLGLGCRRTCVLSDMDNCGSFTKLPSFGCLSLRIVQFGIFSSLRNCTAHFVRLRVVGFTLIPLVCWNVSAIVEISCPDR